jgi:hypothetical protein
MRYQTRGTFIGLLVLFSGAATPVDARLWIVSNSGVDSASCGSYAKPCRTISQAIANASDGDQIAVGPGLYGDVSGKATYSGPGDERAGPMIFANGEANFVGCVLCIDKAVEITSFAGAAETIIQGNLAATQFPTVVGITRDGVTFGTPGHGFTVTGGKWGVAIAEMCGKFAASVSVAGNVAVGDDVGFEIAGYFDGTVPGVCSTVQVQLSHNTATGNADTGFVIQPDEFLNPIVVQKNLAMGNANVGFTVFPGDSFGDLSGDAHNVTLLNNVATQSGVGFSLAQFGKAQYNTATNNTFAGFSLDADLFDKPFTIFSYNAAVGNRGPGVIVWPEQESGGFADFSHNDFIGNDRDRTVTSLPYPAGPLNFGPSAHCGLLNTGFSYFYGFPLVGGAKIQSLHDFWGTSQGPQAKGPGDEAGGVCDLTGAVTTVVPFSTTAYAFTSVALLLQ